ncbi:hypothetical protein EJ06DRAFT_220500 [Trichodelitschia bisporula]|uniref:Hydrophobic surface binding protein A n=1 Tax=Trichodelitschia bisporula TaxID=703511 RepID=A0A6G1I9G0_9PEZI|nr:hypothetical protein EJ06DRAFT_220500 [Trichodelitschia bisporula]
MHFSSLITFALLGAAWAAPSQAITEITEIDNGLQQVAPVLAALGDVTAKLQDLQSALAGITESSPAATAKAALDAKSKAIEDALDKAAKDTTAAQAIPLTGALQLQGPSGKLVTATKDVINALIAKKPIIEKAGFKADVKGSLTRQKAKSDALVKAIQGKLPAAVQSLVASATKDVGDALEKGIAAFS